MWAKFDDSYFENRKIRRVPGQARLLHMAAIIQCSQVESDGLFLKTDLPLIAAKAGVDEAVAMAEKLVSENLLHDRGDSYEVHDYLDYNPSHAELEAKRASGANRVKNWRRNGKRNAVTPMVTGSATNTVTNHDTNGVSTERPVPDLSLRDQSYPEKRESPGTNGVGNSVTEKRPTGHDLLVLFGAMRSEVFPNTLPWNTARDTKGDSGSFAALLSGEEVADIEETMRLALEKIKNGSPGWTNHELAVSPSFAYGKWKSDFTGLREELHGCAPQVKLHARLNPGIGRGIPTTEEPTVTGRVQMP
jgi:hypothetical protein